ncbi:hypothetical protein [Billgrantia sp. C5P2]|uniref:hypothetical protein n=1 Tax=Billgrantia sp. C5P2 TaxID=3436239 RepID=UPI003DA63A66
MNTLTCKNLSRSHDNGLIVIACYSLQVERSSPTYISARSWQEALRLAMPEPCFVILRITSTGVYAAAWLGGGGEGEIQSTTGATKQDVMLQAREKWRQGMESHPADLVRPRMAILYRRLSAKRWFVRKGEYAWEALLDLLGKTRHNQQRREIFAQFLDRFTAAVPANERLLLLRRLEQLTSYQSLESSSSKRA